MSRILTVIVGYNFMPWADRCLDSLRASTMHTDVLVVDNASTDGTVDYIRARYPWVRLIANRYNLGFGQANNIGMRIALEEGYDAVFLMNEDAWLANDDALMRLVEVWQHAGRNDVGIWSPLHLAGNGCNLDFGFAHYSGIDSIDKIPRDDSVQIPFVNAAFWLIPADVLRCVGGFSPLFFMYGEDVDYVNRLRCKKLTIRYVPSSKMCHDRELRVETADMRLRGERVWHLSEYANPNYTFPKAFAYGVVAAFKKGLRNVALLRIALWLLWRTPHVLRHRFSSHRFKIKKV